MKPTIQELKDFLQSYLLIKDPFVLEAMVAIVFAHFTPADPIWTQFVAPPGGAKSEFINALSQIKGKRPGGNPDLIEMVHALSTVTSKTFASGMRNVGKDTSLLNQITNGIITFKDFTSLLAEHKEERGVIMAQLREIYDGKYTKQFGTGYGVDWKGKITIISGVTYAIHSKRQQYSALGERFIFYNIQQPDRKEAARRAMQNQREGKMPQFRQELAEKVAAYIEAGLNNFPKEKIVLSEETINDTVDIANLATMARSDVERNWNSREEEIVNVHPAEMPTRFAGQLQAMIQGLMILNYQETGKMELAPGREKVISKIAFDSIDRVMHLCLLELTRYEEVQTAGVATTIGLPTTSIRRRLEDLTALGVVERTKGSGPKGDNWIIKDEFRRIVSKFESIELKGGALTGDNAVPDENLLEEAEMIRQEEEANKEELNQLGL